MGFPSCARTPPHRPGLARRGPGAALWEILAGILMEQGVLDDAARVTELLPSLWPEAPMRGQGAHLLDMRVGLDFSEDYSDPECDFAYMDAACDWRPPIRPDAS